MQASNDNWLKLYEAIPIFKPRHGSAGGASAACATDDPETPPSGSVAAVEAAPAAVFKRLRREGGSMWFMIQMIPKTGPVVGETCGGYRLRCPSASSA